MHSAWSNHLCIDFFYAAPCPPSCKVNLQVYECILYCVQGLLPNKNAYAIKKHRNPLELHKASAPELSGTLPSTCTRTLRNLTGYVHRNPPEPHQVLVPLSGTLPSICTRYLKSHQVSAPKPSRTSPGICTWNPPEPQQVSAPEPSRTSPGICTGTLRNLTRYLHRNPPEPHQVPQQVSAPEPLRNLARNLVEAAPDRTRANLS